MAIYPAAHDRDLRPTEDLYAHLVPRHGAEHLPAEPRELAADGCTARVRSLGRIALEGPSHAIGGAFYVLDVRDHEARARRRLGGRDEKRDRTGEHEERAHAHEGYAARIPECH